jgi:hypothetical protein
MAHAAQDKFRAGLQPVEAIPIRTRVFSAENANRFIRFHPHLLTARAHFDNSKLPGHKQNAISAHRPSPRW